LRAAILQSAQTGLHEAENRQLDTTGRYRLGKAKGFKHRLAEVLTPEELARPSARWLDIGCGFGELLSAAAELLPPDARVEGIEPSLRKRQSAVRRGLSVSDAGLETLPSASFDFVSLINVFSHLPEPADFLCQVARLLKPGGLLILLTGNGGDLARDQYPGPFCLPDHLIFVGEAALISLLERAGFTVLSLQSLQRFFQESVALRLLKNTARFASRRPLVRANGAFRDLFVKAARNVCAPE
jgi:SAM-dependent methyltransferase